MAAAVSAGQDDIRAADQPGLHTRTHTHTHTHTHTRTHTHTYGMALPSILAAAIVKCPPRIACPHLTPFLQVASIARLVATSSSMFVDDREFAVSALAQRPFGTRHAMPSLHPPLTRHSDMALC
jgi:hypothetical protein